MAGDEITHLAEETKPARSPCKARTKARNSETSCLGESLIFCSCPEHTNWPCLCTWLLGVRAGGAAPRAARLRAGQPVAGASRAEVDPQRVHGTWLWVKTVLGSHFQVGEFTTHFRTCFSGGLNRMFTGCMGFGPMAKIQRGLRGGACSFWL